MAEITKVSTPIVPQENIGNKYKPTTDQAFDLTDPSKVHKPADEGKILDNPQHKQGDGSILKDSMGRAAILPLLQETGELAAAVKRLAVLIGAGISASGVMKESPIKELLDSLFFTPETLTEGVREQDRAAVLFKGEAFDILRDILEKFPDNPKMREAMTNLLKTFEQNVNTQNSLRSVIINSENLLDYMFSKDREQFSAYLENLSETILPKEGEGVKYDAAGNPMGQPEIPQKEIAAILKGNLLPLLGEIVVKYHQNEHIRDIVMVVIHNIVRVDQGSMESLREAVNQLVQQLRIVANLPENFAANLGKAVMEATEEAKLARNETVTKLVEVLSETLRSENSSPATLRQAETLLLSLLQNQGSMMNLLHFILPMATPQGPVFAEMFVDPDSSQGNRRQPGEPSRKVFLSFHSESHGDFELSFVQAGNYVDFSMWCPQALLATLQGLRRQFADIMQVHGYTMSDFAVEEFVRAQSVLEVFPNLLSRRVGIDVKI